MPGASSSGTFNTKAKAVDAARKLMRSHAAVLGGGMMTTIERGRKFRPIILNMNERQATAACKRLRQAKAYCVVVTPKNLSRDNCEGGSQTAEIQMTGSRRPWYRNARSSHPR